MKNVTTALLVLVGWIGLSIPVLVAVGAFFRRSRPVALRVRTNGSLDGVPFS